MKIIPRNDRVLMVREKEKTTTESGIIIPQGTTERQDIAVVLNMGKNVKDIIIGDKVLYKPYSTLEISLDGEEFLIIKEEDITAKVED